MMTEEQFKIHRDREKGKRGVWIPSSFNQYRALATDVYELFYGGSSGGGKSEFLLIDASKQIKIPQYHGLLMRNTFPELEKSLIMRSLLYYPAMGGKYNSQLHRWTFRTGATIEFGYSENDIDIQNYKSSEYGFIGLDESTTFSQFQIEYIKSRNRSSSGKVKKKFRLASNPTGKSHIYHKRRFIESKLPYVKYYDEKTRMPGLAPLEYMFVPAKATDNIVLVENDPTYIQKLNQLPEKERKALLEGNWDIFEGMYFNQWDSSAHVCEPYELASSFPRFMCLDYGYTNPSAVYWIAVDNESRLVVYRELWGTGYTFDKLAERATEMMTGEERRKISYVVADPAVFTSKAGEKSLAEVWGNAYKFYMIKGNNDRLTGWRYLQQVLEQKKIVFFNTCYNALRTIPQLQHDDKRPEDLDTNQKDENGLNLDDCADAIRYGLLSRYTKYSKSDTLIENTNGLKNFQKLQNEYLNKNYAKEN